MYGGRNPITGTLYDETYVLTLPAFTWVKLLVGESPRYAHTCHLVGKRQMLTVGGSLSPANNLTEQCDWESKGVAILDLSTLQWGSAFDAYASPYEVPQNIYQEIGGK